MTGELFLQLLQNVSAMSYEDAAFICDNASAHASANRRNLTRRPNRLNASSTLHACSTMMNTVRTPIMTFKAALAKAWFRKMQSFIPQCLQMQDIDIMCYSLLFIDKEPCLGFNFSSNDGEKSIIWEIICGSIYIVYRFDWSRRRFVISR